MKTIHQTFEVNVVAVNGYISQRIQLKITNFMKYYNRIEQTVVPFIRTCFIILAIVVVVVVAHCNYVLFFWFFSFYFVIIIIVIYSRELLFHVFVVVVSHRHEKSIQNQIKNFANTQKPNKSHKRKHANAYQTTIQQLKR